VLNFSLDRWGGGSTRLSSRRFATILKIACRARRRGAGDSVPPASSRRIAARKKRLYLGTVDDLKTVQAEVFLLLSVLRKYLSLKRAGSRARTDDLLITNQCLEMICHELVCIVLTRKMARGQAFRALL
jgi:hypothetical protein